MLVTMIQLFFGGLLLASAATKLAAPNRSQAALATFGVRAPRAQAGLWAVLIAVEAGLGVGVIAALPAAAYAAAGLMLVFAGVLALALRRGEAGRPCGCLGPRSRVSRVAVARTLVLAAAFALLPSLPAAGMSERRWLEVGLAVALVGLAVLGVVVLALAREVAELRLAVGPQIALDVEGEGPELGARADVVGDLTHDREARLALAVFSSDACPMCRALEPSVAALARDPFVAARVFDEVRDADVWRALDVPGSPYAVALDLDGTVLAKGTFNSLGQLEALLGTAERRRAVALV